MSSPVQRPVLPPRNPGSNLQIVFGAILAISLLLAINFSGRIAAGQRISSDRDNMLESISTLQAQATALRSQLNYVSSDAFIEQWARGEGKMVKGDEVLVVPVPGATTPQPRSPPRRNRKTGNCGGSCFLTARRPRKATASERIKI